jgi:hypothetical protein
MEVHAVSEPSQLDLFLDETEINPADCVDLSEIDIDFGDGSTNAKMKSLNCARLQALPKKKFLIYKGKEGELPYIENTHTGKIVSINSGRTNYPCVKIHPHIYALHVLIGMAFIPNPLPKDRTQVDHIDGDKFNYAIENLRWVTPSENMTFVHSKKEIELDL